MLNLKVCFSVMVGLVSVSIIGCSGSGDSPKVLNVYSARHYETDTTLYDAFTKKTGVKIRIVEGNDDQLIERLQTEGKNSAADVFITVDAGRLWRAEQAGIFQPIESSNLKDRIPVNLRDPEGRWFGLTTRARIIVYNKKKVKPQEVSSYEALGEPQWKGRVCIRSSSNVYNQSLLGSMIESNGVKSTEAWARKLVNNLARSPQGGDIDQIKAVAVGVCDAAIVNHYYVARLQKSSKAELRDIFNKVGIVFPNQSGRGTHVNISGAGVVASAPHKVAAIEFLEYLVSPDAQQVFAQGNNEYPVVKGTRLDPTLAQYGNFKSDSVNVSSYGKNSPEALKLADRVGWK